MTESKYLSKYSWAEEIGWWIAALIFGTIVCTAILIACWFILFPLIGWLYHNGLSGVWEIISNFFSAIWHGVD